MTNIPTSSAGSERSLFQGITDLASQALDAAKKIKAEVEESFKAAAQPVSPEELAKVTQTKKSKINFEALDEKTGLIRDPVEIKNARERILQAVEKFPRSEMAKALGSRDPAKIKEAFQNYLLTETELPLLPAAEKKSTLAQLSLHWKGTTVRFDKNELDASNPPGHERHRFAHYLRLQANDFKQKGKLHAAAELYEKALDLFRWEPALRFQAARVYQKLGDQALERDLKKAERFYGKALGHFKGALELHGGHWQALKGSGEILLKINRPGDAEKVFQEASRLANATGVAKAEQDALQQVLDRAVRAKSPEIPGGASPLEDKNFQKTLGELAQVIPGLQKAAIEPGDVIGGDPAQFQAGIAQREKALQEILEKSAKDPRIAPTLDPKLPVREGVVAYFTRELQAKAQLAGAISSRTKLSTVNHRQLAVLYQEASEAAGKLFILAGNPSYAQTAVNLLYQAGNQLKEAGSPVEAKRFFQKGVDALREFHHRTEPGKLLSDPKTLRLLAQGLRELGEFPQALQILARARQAGDLSPELIREVAFVAKQAETLEALGRPFLDRLTQLEKKAAPGNPLSAAEKQELSFKRRGVELLEQANRSYLPSTKGDMTERWALRQVRENVLSAIRSGDGDALEGAAEEIKDLQSAMGKLQKGFQAREALLSHFPIYIQDYVRRTNDWSGIKLKDSPFFKDFQELKKSHPGQAKRLEEFFDLISKPDLLPDGGAADLNRLQDAALDIEKKSEGIETLVRTLVDGGKEKSLAKEPLSFIRDRIEKQQTNLKNWRTQLENAGKLKQELTQTLGALAHAKKAKDQPKIEALQKQVAFIQENLKNYRTVLGSQAKQLIQDLKAYRGHADKLGVRESNGRVPFDAELMQASVQAEKILATIKNIDPGNTPDQAFQALTEQTQALAGAQGILLRSLAFTNSAVANAWSWGRRARTKEGPEEIESEEWKKAKARLTDLSGNKPSGNIKNIDRLLAGTDSFLRETDEKLFEDLPTTLRGQIDREIAIVEDKRKLMLGHTSTEDVESYIGRLNQAREALRDGEVPKALSLYREATEGVQGKRVHEEIAKFKTPHEKARDFAFNLAILLATGYLSGKVVAFAASRIAWLAKAQEAVGLGAGSFGQQAVVHGTQAALFVGFEKSLKGIFLGENPFLSADGSAKTLPKILVDLFYETGKTALMFKFLAYVNQAYQADRLGKSLLQDPQARELLTEAFAASPRLGRAALNLLLQREVQAMRGIQAFGFKAGGIATEAVGFQAWGNFAATLDTIYQNTVHGQKLSWKQQLLHVNSPEGIAEGLGTILALKLHHFADHKFKEKLQAKRAEAAAKRDLEQKLADYEKFQKAASVLQRKIQTPEFWRNPQAAEKAIRGFINFGDRMFSVGKVGRAGSPEFLTIEQRIQWEEIRTLLEARPEVKPASSPEARSSSSASPPPTPLSEKQMTALELGFRNGTEVVQKILTPAGRETYLLFSPGRKPIEVNKQVSDLYLKIVGERFQGQTREILQGAAVKPEQIAESVSLGLSEVQAAALRSDFLSGKAHVQMIRNPDGREIFLLHYGKGKSIEVGKAASDLYLKTVNERFRQETQQRAEGLPIKQDQILSEEKQVKAPPPIPADAVGSAEKPKGIGVAEIVPISAVEGKADKIAKAEPSPARLARYAREMQKRFSLSWNEAMEQAKGWAKKVIHDARAHQANRLHIYDTNLPAKAETAHLDKATIDHHGRFANPKNATEQLLDRFETVLEVARNDPKALEAARKDSKALKAAGGDVVVAAALKELNLRQVTTDNLADGGWSVWMARNQSRILKDKGLRDLIREATHFEDFTAFGTTYNENTPGVRLQAALFQKYGEILKNNGIVGSDRFAPEQAKKVLGEALSAIDEVVNNHGKREAAATEFFNKVEEARKVASQEGVIRDASVQSGSTQLTFFDLTKLGQFTVFQQWLALPRVQAQAGIPHTLQVSVVPMKPLEVKNADGTTATHPRSLQIVAVPDGRELPSGKNLKSAVTDGKTVLDLFNEAEARKAQELGLDPEKYKDIWFGKESVILPKPFLGGTLLTPLEISALLTQASWGLFKPAAAPISIAAKRRRQAAQASLPSVASSSPERGLPLAARHGGPARPSPAENKSPPRLPKEVQVERWASGLGFHSAQAKKAGNLAIKSGVSLETAREILQDLEPAIQKANPLDVAEIRKYVAVQILGGSITKERAREISKKVKRGELRWEIPQLGTTQFLKEVSGAKKSRTQSGSASGSNAEGLPAGRVARPEARPADRTLGAPETNLPPVQETRFTGPRPKPFKPAGLPEGSALLQGIGEWVGVPASTGEPVQAGGKTLQISKTNDAEGNPRYHLGHNGSGVKIQRRGIQDPIEINSQGGKPPVELMDGDQILIQSPDGSLKNFYFRSPEYLSRLEKIQKETIPSLQEVIKQKAELEKGNLSPEIKESKLKELEEKESRLREEIAAIDRPGKFKPESKAEAKEDFFSDLWDDVNSESQAQSNAPQAAVPPAPPIPLARTQVRMILERYLPRSAKKAASEESGETGVFIPSDPARRPTDYKGTPNSLEILSRWANPKQELGKIGDLARETSVLIQELKLKSDQLDSLAVEIKYLAEENSPRQQSLAKQYQETLADLNLMVSKIQKFEFFYEQLGTRLQAHQNVQGFLLEVFGKDLIRTGRSSIVDFPGALGLEFAESDLVNPANGQKANEGEKGVPRLVHVANQVVAGAEKTTPGRDGQYPIPVEFGESMITVREPADVVKIKNLLKERFPNLQETNELSLNTAQLIYEPIPGTKIRLRIEVQTGRAVEPAEAQHPQHRLQEALNARAQELAEREGLKPGTSDFLSRVKEISNHLQDQLESFTANRASTLASLARELGLGSDPAFLNDLARQLAGDVQAVGRLGSLGVTREIVEQRVQSAKKLAERYGVAGNELGLRKLTNWVKQNLETNPMSGLSESARGIRPPGLLDMGGLAVGLSLLSSVGDGGVLIPIISGAILSAGAHYRHSLLDLVQKAKAWLLSKPAPASEVLAAGRLGSPVREAAETPRPNTVPSAPSAKLPRDPNGKIQIPDSTQFSLPETTDPQWSSHRRQDLGGAAGGAHPGIGYKKAQEDRFDILKTSRGTTVTVALDGVGGRQGGERAAELGRQVIRWALENGATIPEAIDVADRAIARDAAGGGKKPGAVLVVTETIAQGDGSFELRQYSVGDAEAVIFDAKSGDYRDLQRTAPVPRGKTVVIRTLPFRNVVDQALGGHYRPGKSAVEVAETPPAKVAAGSIHVAGSDGFWENFSHYAEVGRLIKASGENSAAGIQKVLLNEVLIRQQLIQDRKASGEPEFILTPDRLAAAYRKIHGEQPPTWWKQHWQKHYEGKSLRSDRAGDYFVYEGDKVIGTFKPDNVSVVVTVVGKPVTDAQKSAATPPPIPGDGAQKSQVTPPPIPADAGVTKKAGNLKIGGELLKPEETRELGDPFKGLKNNGDEIFLYEKPGASPNTKELFLGTEAEPGAAPLFKLRRGDRNYWLEPANKNSIEFKHGKKWISLPSHGKKLDAGRLELIVGDYPLVLEIPPLAALPTRKRTAAAQEPRLAAARLGLQERSPSPTRRPDPQASPLVRERERQFERLHLANPELTTEKFHAAKELAREKSHVAIDFLLGVAHDRSAEPLHRWQAALILYHDADYPKATDLFKKLSRDESMEEWHDQIRSHL